MAGLFVDNLTPEQIENARKWIEALRSGRYKQGYSLLHPHPDEFGVRPPTLDEIRARFARMRPVVDVLNLWAADGLVVVFEQTHADYEALLELVDRLDAELVEMREFES